jgi:hypothetical protein
MGAKENAKLVEMTGGQLKYIQNFETLVSDVGFDIDFSILDFEQTSKKCNHIEIYNKGPNNCMIGFDTEAALVDCLDRSTFNFPIYSGKPYNYISHDGEAGSISMRTLTGETATILILVW